MTLEGICVKLWKTGKVSYLQIDSNGTGWFGHSLWRVGEVIRYLSLTSESG